MKEGPVKMVKPNLAIISKSPLIINFALDYPSYPNPTDMRTLIHFRKMDADVIQRSIVGFDAGYGSEFQL